MAPPNVHTVYHPGTEGPLPTVIAIHGHGANGFDLLGLAPGGFEHGQLAFQGAALVLLVQGHLQCEAVGGRERR